MHSFSYIIFYAFYIVFTYFASFTGYEDGNFEVISNLHIQGSKFGKKLNSAEFMKFVLDLKSALREGFKKEKEESVTFSFPQ